MHEYKTKEQKRKFYDSQYWKKLSLEHIQQRIIEQINKSIGINFNNTHWVIQEES